MISLFGDLARGDGDVIEGPVLTAIMAALDIKPEAARVALHRLRNDGWITSSKVGRISHHSLTADGLRQTIAAIPRIYSTPDEAPRGWQLVLLKDGATLRSDAFVQLSARLYAGPATAPLPKEALALNGATAPGWLRDEVAQTAQLDGYADLHAALVDLSGALADLSPLETAVLRCLIVHNWRRVVLKHPIIPHDLIRPDGPEHLCHLIVADVLARYPRPSLQDIAQDIAVG